MSGPPVEEPDLVLTPGTNVETIVALAPPWLLDEFSIKFLFTLALQDDGLGDWIRLGVLQQFPQVPQCQPQALAAVGKDRQISRGRNEPTASYALRVRQARTTWKHAGNAQTLLRQISAYFGPSVPLLRYVVNGRDETGTPFADWTTLSQDGTVSTRRSSPNNWNWDGNPGKVRFWVIIYSPVTPILWGASPTGSGLDWGAANIPPGPPTTGNSWGYLGDSQWYVDVKQIIDQWKAAGSHAGTYPSCDAGIIAVGGPDALLAFHPDYPVGGVAGAPMPTGDWENPTTRQAGFTNIVPVYLSGV